MNQDNNNNTDNNDLFLIAARKKYRFVTNKGQLSAEDLFDLKLDYLDEMAIRMDEDLQKKRKGSFVSGRKERGLSDEQNMFDIVLYVINTKIAEDEARKAKAANSAQKEFLKSLLDKKKMEQLEGLSIDDIQKQLDSIG